MSIDITKQFATAADAFSDILREVILESNTGLAGAALQEVAIVLSALGNTAGSGAAKCIAHDKQYLIGAIKKLNTDLAALLESVEAAPDAPAVEVTEVANG